MTEDDFKEKITPIFADGPAPENLDKAHVLMEEAAQTIPKERLLVLCCEALDAAYPLAVAIRGPALSRLRPDAFKA